MLARLLDLDVRRVQQLAKQGVIPKGGRNAYPLVGAVRGYVKFLRDRQISGDTGRSEYGEERTALIRARREAQELANAQLRSELIPQAEIETMIVGLASGAAQKLRGVPSKAAPIAHAAETLAEAESVIRRSIDEALEEIAAEAERFPVEEPKPASA